MTKCDVFGYSNTNSEQLSSNLKIHITHSSLDLYAFCKKFRFQNQNNIADFFYKYPS